MSASSVPLNFAPLLRLAIARSGTTCPSNWSKSRFSSPVRLTLSKPSKGEERGDEDERGNQAFDVHRARVTVEEIGWAAHDSADGQEEERTWQPVTVKLRTYRS